MDGILDDKVWENIPIATDFVELQPKAGVHEKPEERTEVKIIYDNSAIYIGARMYETSADKVAKEIATRDQVGNADFIGLIFDTYQDGINGTGFFVTSANSQFDAKYTPPNADGNTEDANWNAVWTSKVHLDSLGWTCEMRIPYSALRFSGKEVQTWGMNLIRKRQRILQQLFWNEIDPKANGFINQEGTLTGLQNLKPPVRLAFYPYFSTYVNHYPYNTAGVKNTTTSVNGGMDVKYGINDAFTLDLTLIPDFGQVQSDNKVLNLTPFEVKYNENRPFFTEGTELFNKGNLFYSRRVGGAPIHADKAYDGLAPGEEVISNPTETKLLNAFKFSGRTAKGLGIGVFNAITNSTDAVIEDSVGNRRRVQTSPVANYNIIVLDQNLKNNSAITLINTNVSRFNKDYSSDVGGLVYSINNKKNTYKINGFAFMSNVYGPGIPTKTGYSYEVFGGKSSGNFTWNIGQDLMTKGYDQNDLGIMFNNNFVDNQLNLQYTDYKPKHLFTQWGVWTNTYYSRRVTPSSYQAFNQNFGGFGTFKNLWQWNINAHYRVEANDYYEPRVAGLLFKRPENFVVNWNLSTNRAKKLSGGFWYANQFYNNGHGGRGNDLELFLNLRLSNKFSIGEDVTMSPRINVTGFSTLTDSGNPVFALRDVHTVENIFTLKYTFSAIMGLNFRLRHYWSKVNNKDFFNLGNSGYLTTLASTDFDHNLDQNLNLWNIDMIYVWQFTPGSELSLSWKNSTVTSSSLANQNYFGNLRDTYDVPKNNNFSLKVLYYIDYQSLRRHKG
ncbi:MAG: carbohydrate binding family 9 domain-containing protein [Mucilaginibacter sp.]|nr:carbohydrate binding family 9 domain-containing protein [Mucilaginibacter sp.]